MLYGRPRNQGPRSVQPLITDVGYTVGLDVPPLPSALIIEGHTPPCHQAVVADCRDCGTCRIDETIKPDIGIDHLELRRDAEIFIDRQPLAGFDTECLTSSIVVICKNTKKL